MSAKGLKLRRELRADLNFREAVRELIVGADRPFKLLTFPADSARQAGRQHPEAGAAIIDAAPAISSEPPDPGAPA